MRDIALPPNVSNIVAQRVGVNKAVKKLLMLKARAIIRIAAAKKKSEDEAAAAHALMLASARGVPGPAVVRSAMSVDMDASPPARSKPSGAPMAVPIAVAPNSIRAAVPPVPAAESASAVVLAAVPASSGTVDFAPRKAADDGKTKKKRKAATAAVLHQTLAVPVATGDCVESEYTEGHTAPRSGRSDKKRSNKVAAAAETTATSDTGGPSARRPEVLAAGGPALARATSTDAASTGTSMGNGKAETRTMRKKRQIVDASTASDSGVVTDDEERGATTESPVSNFEEVTSGSLH